MNNTFQRLVTLGRSEFNTLPLFVRNSKIMEELGEFSEALMHKMGFLPHKIMKEPLVGEAADVILCIVDTLSCAYPELSDEEVVALLQEHLLKKSYKWEKVMNIRHSAIHTEGDK